ncbi:hypothetical protein GLOIN_2v1778046 [Rhizophagus clarus]|uniref:Uncharacterized protein n=1 Tax=Rhizophagus clarus TaxID=94130 RepID=A0A8H3M5L8_9GLOM|nr:hypothetical protein GLOIN_2v1778046 [Rhizophagus clarus]
MTFYRYHPRQRRTCEEYKIELEENNCHLRNELQLEIGSNRQYARRIRELKCEYSRCEAEIHLTRISEILRKILLFNYYYTNKMPTIYNDAEFIRV